MEHRDRFFKEKPFPYVKQTGICWRLIGPFDHKGDLSRSFPVEKEIKESYVVDGKKYEWRKRIAWGGTIHIRHPFGAPSWIDGARKGTVYALTYMYSPREKDAWMWINFNTTSLSGGRRGSGNPPLGKWSWMESKAWLNDKQIAPPRWKRPGLYGHGTLEIEITDETYINRPPTSVHFKKGWNKLLIKAPAGRWKGRKNLRWCFTAVPVSWNGKRAREDNEIRFSVYPGYRDKESFAR